MPYTSCSRAGQCAALTLVVRGTPQQAFAAFTVRHGRLARNPAHDVPLPRAAMSDKVYLTIEQVEQLAEAAGEYRLVILFLAYTGVRFGELSALRVRRLDLMRRGAEIAEAVAEVAGRAVFSTPKSHQVRSVPIPRFLVDELARHVAGKSSDDSCSPRRAAACCGCRTSGTPSSTGRRRPPDSTT